MVTSALTRFYVREEDLLDLNVVKARDLIVRCFYEAQKETIAKTKEFLHLPASDEDIHKRVVAMVRSIFAEVGGNFDKPTKENLVRTIEVLAEKCSAWGAPKEIIEYHRGEIEKVLSRL